MSGEGPRGGEGIGDRWDVGGRGRVEGEGKEGGKDGRREWLARTRKMARQKDLSLKTFWA